MEKVSEKLSSLETIVKGHMEQKLHVPPKCKIEIEVGEVRRSRPLRGMGRGRSFHIRESPASASTHISDDDWGD